MVSPVIAGEQPAIEQANRWPEHPPSGPGRKSVAALPDDRPLSIIRPRRGWQLVNIGELWAYRGLIYFLTWRDVKVRYKQTFLGATWAIIQPAMMMVVFTIFFSRMAGVPSGDLPYPVFVFAGLLPWTFFSNAIGSASQSVVGNQSLVTKVYFPRLIIPLGAAAAGLVDFAIAFGMLLVMMLCYGVVPGWEVVLLPLLLFNLFIAAVGLGAFFAALTVAYRDFRYVVPFLLQLGMFGTPAIYLDTAQLAHSRWQTLLLLNPMNGVIGNFRLAMLGGRVDPLSLVIPLIASGLLLLGGCCYFRRVEQSFADVI